MLGPKSLQRLLQVQMQGGDTSSVLAFIKLLSGELAKLAKPGEPVVIICGTTTGTGSTNQIKVEYVQEPIAGSPQKPRLDDNAAEFNGCTIS